MKYRLSVLQSIRTLPEIPGNAQHLLKLLETPEVDPEEICRAITFDPILTAMVLGIANSALHSSQVEVHTVQAAVRRLGTRYLVSAILSAAVKPIFQNTKITCYDTQPGSLWEQSVVLALAAEEVAPFSGLVAPSEAFTAGLLADCGKMAIAEVAAQESKRLVENTLKCQVPFDESERTILEIDHPEAGALLLERWGLPQGLIVPIRWHHRPSLCPPEYQPMADTLHVAQSLANQLGMVQAFDELHMRFDPSSLERLYLGSDDLDITLYRIGERLDAVFEAFGVGRRAA